jgi:membrane-associated PAP2 superfamily phosphatase
MTRQSPFQNAISDPIVLILVYILAVTVIFLFAPGVDMWATGLFYDPSSGFAAGNSPALQVLRRSQDWAIAAILVALLAGLGAKLLIPAWPRTVSPSAALFLIVTLIVGPGLLVNVLLKDHWGRPRPATVLNFGGGLPYVDVWRVSDYCSQNCSFVSGEASTAIWLMALGLVVPRRYRLAVLLITGLYGLALSVNRIAAGRHFLSDVLLAWGLTALVIAVFYRLLYQSPPAFLRKERLEASIDRLASRIRRPVGTGEAGGSHPSVMAKDR